MDSFAQDMYRLVFNRIILLFDPTCLTPHQEPRLECLSKACIPTYLTRPLCDFDTKFVYIIDGLLLHQDSSPFERGESTSAATFGPR